MLNKISQIQFIKNFLNFSNTLILGKKNIVYALNGAGKTNLSRLIDCIVNNRASFESLKSREAGTMPSKFKMFIDDEEINESNYVTKNIKNVLVYNSDYVEDNIRTSNFSDKKLDGKLEIELGEEHKTLAELEATKKDKESSVSDIEQLLKGNLKNKINEITQEDKRGIKNKEILIYDNLTSQKYHQNLSQKEDYDDAEGKKSEGWAKAKENFDSIKSLDPNKDKINFNMSEIDSKHIDFAWIIDQLQKEVLFAGTTKDARLKEHIDKLSNEWIRSGLDYHQEDKDHCPFCRLALDEEAKTVIQQYKDHIASEKTKFEDNADAQIKNIDSLIENIKKLNNNLKEVFDQRAKNLNLSITWKEINTAELTEEIKQLKEKLQQKKLSPEKIFIPEITNSRETQKEIDPISEIKDKLISLNKIISSNKSGIDLINKSLSDLGVRQTTLRELLGKKYLVEFYESNKIIIEERDKIKAEIIELDKEIITAKNRLPSADVAEKIIELFNYFMHQIGIYKYTAELADNRIILRLEKTHDISENANKIVSEGEKNAIAFSYFLASSIRTLNSAEKFSKATFVIDDPVCSMSYKYFYGICNVIKGFYKVIQTLLKGNTSEETHQLIILTHNIQFYNMLANNVFKKKAEYFELNNIDTTHTLRKVKAEEKLSDFHASLRRVQGYAEGKIHENIGNDLRKVLETLCHFHGYTLDPDNVKILFPDAKGSLLMMANDGSHSDFNNFEDPFDSVQYIEMSNELLTIMQPRYAEVIRGLPKYE